MLRHLTYWTLIMVSGIAGALAAKSYLQRESGRLFRYGKDLPEVIYLVEQAYVDDVDMGKIMPGAFQGTLDAIDENASYMPPGSNPEINALAVFHRTGMALVKQNNYVYIMGVADGSPAQKGGVAARMYIRRINGVSTRNMNLHKVLSLFQENTPFTLHLLKPGEVDDEEKSFEVEPFQLQPLKSEEAASGVTRLVIPHAYEGFSEDLEKALGEVPKDHKLVLDLRENALGDEAFLQVLASHFLKKGDIAFWQNNKSKKLVISNKHEGTWSKGELFVLTDHTTSGGAEIFAAAVRQQEVGRLAGQRTLGLTSRFETMALKSGGWVRMPTYRLILPDEAVLTGKGVKTQLMVKTSELEDYTPESLYQAALELIIKGENTEETTESSSSKPVSQDSNQEM